MPTRCWRSASPWSAASRACRCSARRNTPCACRWIPTSWPPAASASTKCSAPSQRATPTCPPARLDGDKQAFTIESSGSAGQRGRLPPHHRRLSQRRSPVRLEQLGNVIDSVENDKVVAWYNDKRAIILAIQRQPGTNTVEVVDNVKALLPRVPQARFRRPSISRSPSTPRSPSAAPSTTWSSRWCSPSAWS